MELYSYVLPHDSGFAPNPFGGFLSLATCKPKIRASAHPGDIILGTGSASTVGNGKLVYAGIISEVVPLEEYGKRTRFNAKRPASKGDWWKKHGDNIYYMKNDLWGQRKNIHHNMDDLEKDISGKNVLICEKFWYFGGQAIEIPPILQEVVKKGPGHKRIKTPEIIKEFHNWLLHLEEGIHGTPEMEPHNTCGPSCGEKPDVDPRCKGPC
ncbi:MAG: hypothetical protein GY754_17370 [bacterium]|nr:hypothetical protein [bacterium]